MAKKNVNIKIKADSKDAEKGINKVSGELNKLSKKVQNNPISKLTKSLFPTIQVFSSVSKVIKGTVDKLKDLSEAAQVQIKAERQLETAAKNNPYLNKSNVAQLKSFAGQLQGISAIGDEQLLPLMAQLASAGRTQAEIQEIMSAAVDVAAGGAMSLESAVKNLNKTYSGLSGELGESIPQIKNLTKEQLKNGEAVKIVGNQYKGLAEETTKATGGWQKFKNSWGDLKEILGSDVANAQNNLGNALSNFVDDIANKMKLAKERAQEFKDILTFESEKQSGQTSLDSAQAAVNSYEKELARLKELKELISTETISNPYNDPNSEEVQKELEAQRKVYALKKEINKLEKNSTLIGNQDKLVSLKKELEEHQKILDVNEEAFTRISDLQTKQLLAESEFHTVYKDSKEALDENIAAYEERLQSAKEILAVEQESAKLANEKQDTENKNTEALKLQQAYRDKLTEYDKQAEAQKKVGAELSKEEYLQGKIKVMQQGIVDLVEKSNGLISWQNGTVVNEFLPALQKAQEELKDLTENSAAGAGTNPPTETSADSIIEQWNNRVITAKEAISQINALLDEQKITEQEHANAIGSIYKTAAQNITSEIVNYTSQLSEITSTISSLVSENAEAIASSQTSELKKQYEDGLISYEEYCDGLEKIQKEQAMTEYKASMASWAIQVAQVTASIAQGIASCLKDGFPMGIINGAIISAAGAAQLASVIASKPKKPSFATGGIVQGSSYTGDNVQANVNSGEMILNSKQQLALWRLANNSSSKAGALNQSIVINNTVSNKVQADASITAEKLTITIKEIVNSEMRKGSFRNSMNYSNALNNGVKVL